MAKKLNPLLYTWIPVGLQTGVRIDGTAMIYHLLVLLAAWLMLEKLLARHH